MKLDVAIDGFVLKLTHHGHNRARFTIDYPCEEPYRTIVQDALIKILRGDASISKPQSTEEKGIDYDTVAAP